MPPSGIAWSALQRAAEQVVYGVRAFVRSTQPPRHRVSDEETRRRLRMIAFNAGAALFFSSLFALQYYFVEQGVGPATGVLLAGMLVFVGVLFALPYARSNVGLGLLVPLTVFWIVALVAYADTGLTSAPPLFWHALVPIMAALLVGPWAALLMVALITAEAVSFYLLLPPSPASSAFFAGLSEDWVATLSAIGSAVFGAAISCGYEITVRRAVHARDDALDQLRASNDTLKETHAALVRHEAMLTEAQRISGIGAWHVNLDTYVSYWSAENRRLYGYPAGTPAPTREAFFALIHPEDRAALQAAIARATRTREPDTATFRIQHPDGGERVLRSTAQVVGTDDPDAPDWMVGTTRDVTEKRAYEAHLVQAKENAEASARLKDTILSNLSHEMRTPISSICGFAEIIAEEAGEAHREFAEMICESGKRLGATLSALLELARLEAEDASAHPSTTDAVADIEQVVRTLKPRAAQKDLALSFTTSAGPALDAAPGAAALDADGLVRLDRDGLQRITTSLLDNAIKFTPSGRVEVNVTLGARALTLRVADTGQGISQAFLPRLYDPFQQASNGLDRTHAGMGLGLTIAHRLVDRMDGSIRAESAPGEGTTFTVELPFAAQTAPLAEMAA